MTETLLIYFGLLAAFFGGVSIIKPLKFLKIRNRSRGALVLEVGVVAAIVGFALPIEEYRIATSRTQLDQFAPLYEFNEFHSIRVAAPRDRVYRAMKMVTADEIPLFRTLTWIRRGGRHSPESILNPAGNAPLLEVATRTATVFPTAFCPKCFPNLQNKLRACSAHDDRGKKRLAEDGISAAHSGRIVGQPEVIQFLS